MGAKATPGYVFGSGPKTKEKQKKLIDILWFVVFGSIIKIIFKNKSFRKKTRI